MERDPGVDDGRVRPGHRATRTRTSRASALNLKPGDALLLAGADVARPTHWDLRILTTVEPDADARPHARHVGRARSARLTSVRPAGGSAAAVRAAQAAQRLRPQRAVWLDVERLPHDYARHAATGRVAALLDRGRRGDSVDLDGSHPDVVAGLVGRARRCRRYRELWQVDDRDRAVAGRVRGLRQGHAARSSRAARTTRCSDDQVRETTVFAVQRAARRSPRRPTRPTSRTTRSTSTSTSRRCGRAGGCSSAATTTAGEEHAEPAVVEAVAAGRRPAGGSRSRATSSHDVRARDGRRPRQRRARDARRDRAAAARLGPRERAVPALHARARAADLRPVDRRDPPAPPPRSRCASTTCAGTRCRRCTAPGRATARTRCAPTSTARRTSSSATASAARGCPSGSNNVRAHVPQGHRRRRQRQGRRARAAARPAARRQGRQQPGRRRAAASTRSRRRRRARRSRSACARSAAPCRCSTTRTSRARSPASRRRTRPCSRCAAAARSSSPSRSTGGERLDRPRRRAARRTATRASQVLVLAGTTADVPARAEGRGRPGVRGATRCSPASRRRCARRTRSRRAAFDEPVFQSEIVAVAHTVAGVARRRPRPPLHRHDRRPRRPAARAAARRRRRRRRDPRRAARPRPGAVRLARGDAT